MNSHKPPDGTSPTRSAAKIHRLGLGTTPRDGDLLVARESDSGRYTIRQVPAAVQISAGSRNEAMQLARRFAQQHSVDVWSQDKEGLRLLEAYRVGLALPRKES